MRSMPKAAKPTRSSAVWARCTRGTCGRHAWASRASSARDGRTMLRAQLRAVQPGRADRRARCLPPGRDARSRRPISIRRPAATRQPAGWSIPDSTCGSIPTRARRTRTNTPSASIARSVAGSRLRSPTFERTAPTSSAGRMSAVSIATTRGRCPTAAAVPVFALVNAAADRRFLLANQEGYSLTYNGLVMAVEKRRSHGWQALGSYTLSRAYGLQPSSGSAAASAQVSTVAPPPVPQGLTFGRDPNDLTNATRPPAQRSPAHVPRDGQRRPAADRRPRRGQLSILQRQAVGGDGLGPAAAKQPAAHPARSAGLAPAVVAIAARCARVEDDLARRPGPRRAAPGRAQCAQ